VPRSNIVFRGNEVSDCAMTSLGRTETLRPRTGAPIAKTALGELRGVFRDGIAAFHGAPYAAPPVGDLRFAPARPVSPWSGQRDATQHGPIAPQLPGRLAAVAGARAPRPQGEDCLTLTICTPAPDAQARPVLVWMHGGAWMIGSGSSPQSDGARLAREGDLVFVGVNYRLGALGWMYRPGIVDAELATSDMMAALNWVHDHISAFGGDPSRVTLMGQSAGAMSVARLLMLAETRGLFHRVILQSAGLGRGYLTPDRAASISDQFLNVMEIDPASPDALAKLRGADVSRLLQAQGAVTQAHVRFGETAPAFMGVLPTALTQPELITAVAEGIRRGGCDILIGTVADEVHAHFGAHPMMQDASADEVTAAAGGDDVLAQYRARRPGATPVQLLADLATEQIYLTPRKQLTDAVAAQGSAVYTYLFDWAPPSSRFGSCHNIELAFVFGTLEAWDGSPMLAGGDPAQMDGLSAAMRGAWIAFVHHGSPDHRQLPPWPSYDVTKRPTMRFGARIGVAYDPS
jgi:para-nitrobenzyl esterase